MAEKRSQEEIGDEVAYKRPCVENKNLSDAETADHESEAVAVLPGPASWESRASSSDSSASGSGSGSSSSGGGPRPEANDSSSEGEGSGSDSLDLGIGDVQPQNLPGPMGWLQKQMISGVDPRTILVRIIPSSMSIPDEMDEFEMWSIIAEYLRSIDEPPPRQKLEQYNTFDDAVQLLKSCRKILVLTGAGVSVSCGIPDFRSRDGVYARLAVDFPDLPDPQAMFEISYFRRDPRPFFKFAKELFPGQFKPSTSHNFISQLEQHGKLLRNYAQNIDTLEQAAGITRVIQCHGSFATASCTRCSFKVDSDFIRSDIFNQIVPVCPHCGPDTPEMAVLKPDIVFFGEGLPNHFYNKLDDDKDDADLLIVMGSSLKVRPVATIPSMLPKNVPQILINREPLPHLNFDIELLGDCDVIINEILHRLGDTWNHVCQSKDRLEEVTEKPDIFGKLFRPSHSGDVKQQASPADSQDIKQEPSSSAEKESKGALGSGVSKDEEGCLGTSAEVIKDARTSDSEAEKHFPEEMFPVTPPAESVPSSSANGERVQQEQEALGDSMERADAGEEVHAEMSGVVERQEKQGVERTSSAEDSQKSPDSATSVPNSSVSCLNRVSSDSSTLQADKRNSQENVTSPNSPPFPHPDAQVPQQSNRSHASPEKPHRHHKLHASPEKPHRHHHHHHHQHHHENAASEYMHFQQVLDSTSHRVPHTSCEAMDSRYFADGKKGQHQEHMVKSENHLHHHHESHKPEQKHHRKRTKSECLEHTDHAKSEHRLHRRRSRSECEQNLDHAVSEPSLEQHVKIEVRSGENGGVEAAAVTEQEGTTSEAMETDYKESISEVSHTDCAGSRSEKQDNESGRSTSEAMENEHEGSQSEGAMSRSSRNDDSLADQEPDEEVNHESGDSSSPETTPEIGPMPSTSRLRRDSISTHLKESTYLFIPPSRYIFHGAEVFLSDSSESDVDSHADLAGLAELQDLVHDLDNGDLADDIEHDDNDLASDIENELVSDLENGHSSLHTLHSDVQASSDKGDPVLDRVFGKISQPPKTSSGEEVTNGVNGDSPFEAPSAHSEDQIDIQ